MKPVHLTLGHLRLHQDANDTSWNIYIEIGEKELLQELTVKLSKVLTPFTKEYIDSGTNVIPWEQTDDYYPHISIINGNNMAVGSELLNTLLKDYIPLGKITCSSVTLTKWKSSHWQGIQTFQLLTRI